MKYLATIFNLFIFFLFTGLSTTVMATALPDDDKPLVCTNLESAFSFYAHGSFKDAQHSLLSLNDTQLDSKACQAEKYALLGALEVIAFIMDESETLESADTHFQKVLAIDRFYQPSAKTYPPLLIRRRFDMNRWLMQKADLQKGEATGTNQEDALVHAQINAIDNYVSQYFSERSFNALKQTAHTERLFPRNLITDFEVEQQESSATGVKVTTQNYINRDAILNSVNSSGILFDIESPYVKIDITESFRNEPSNSRVALTTIKKQLQEAGFKVIDENAQSTEAHIHITGNVEVSSIRLGRTGGFGGTAFANLTMTWANGSKYVFGSHTEKVDGKPSANSQEAMYDALETIASPLAEHITKTCTTHWNDRMVNGAVYLVEVKGALDYDDFKKVLTQISTWTLNDPLENPHYSTTDTKIYIQHRPQDEDLADLLRKEGFYNLSRPYKPRVLESSFNHVIIGLN